MKRLRIGWILAVMTVSGAAVVVLWPNARDAGAVLAAQDDPAQLSDIQLNSALQNNQIVIVDNIEAALAAGDAGLADSFVDLAREKNISLASELSQRVSDAVREANSSSHFAMRFANGLVTGNADDVGSLSGTVAGDLFVFGDIRDVVREGKHLVMGEDTDRLVLGLATAGLAVTAATYLSVGGVAPVGHLAPALILIDEDLLVLDPVWAAAGSPTHAFRTTPADLVRVTGGSVANVKA